MAPCEMIQGIVAYGIACAFIPCLALQYTDWPGLVRTHQGQSAAFSWRLDTSLDDLSKEDISFQYRQAGDVTVIYTKTPLAGEVIHPDYLSRVTAEYEDGNHRMTFTLSDMQQDDITGQYSCRVFLQGLGYDDDNVTLFLYKIPEDTTTSPNPAITRESDTFTLTCSATLTSSPASLRPGVGYTWTRNDGPLPARHRVEGSEEQRLVISPVHRDDNQQKYTCVAQETGSSFSGTTETRLDVQYKPGDPVLGASDTRLTEDSILDLTCSLTSDKDGNPDIYTYRWWNSDFSRVYVTQTNTKQFDNLKVTEHDGLWRCEVNNSIGIGQSDALDVNVDAPANLHQSPAAYIEQLYSDTLSEVCEFRAKPGARVSWTYDGGPTVPAAVRIHDSGNRAQDKFTFTSSTLQWEPGASDSQRRGSGGIYRCHGDNNVGGVASSGNININVLYGPVDATVTPTQVTALEGDHVTLTCSSDCSPSCTYTWSRLNDDTFNHAGPVLSFQSIARDAHDTYSCETTNVHGTRPASTPVRVNFGSEIADFSPSSVDLFHGDAVVLMCSVDSRPTSTTVIIHKTTELSRSNDNNTLSYTFNSISILDSGDYKCEAGNGIGPSVSESIPLDIKGGFHFCEGQTNHSSDGLALNVVFLKNICQFANPFTEVSRDSWVFVTSNETHTEQTLPGDVNITIIPTDHQYRKIIHFYIPRISQIHFGIYTMRNGNSHGDDLLYILELNPEGPPEAPYNLLCTKTTAISLYLQWNAGYDGGPDQVFELTYKDLVTSITHRVQIDGAGVQQGEVVKYKLIDNDTIQPEQTYMIQVDARNDKGLVTGPTVVNATLAQLSFEDDPVIEVVDETAYITWSISNLESVSHIIISACDSNVENNCKLTNITDPYIQPYEASLPVADKVYYVFTFYDIGDVLFVHKHGRHNSDKKLPMALIVGVTLGVVAAVTLAVVFLILWRRGIFPRKQKTDSGPEVQYVNVDPSNFKNVQGDKPPEVQYEDVLNLTDVGGPEDNKTYEGLIDENIVKAPTVYEAFSGEHSSLTKYRPSDIRPGDVISRGTVFCVQAAVILRENHSESKTRVVLKQVSSDAEMYKRYLREAARLLSRLGSCSYVVQALGTTADSLLMENVSLGNLRQYLRGMADHAYANTADVIQRECLEFVRQITSGIEAVFNIKPAAMFHCLSTDHVLLGQGQICKLTGFNTAESVRQREQWECDNGTPRPIRWLAPEAIDLRHVPESDIWAFGVLVWEIFNVGLEPYPDTEVEQIVDFVQRGHRQLEMPRSPSSEIGDLVNQCWMTAPAKRPSLAHIRRSMNGPESA